MLETKGVHLKNENTAYKQSVFALCNKHAKKKAWNELVPAMRDKEISYEVVFQDEWEQRLNGTLGVTLRLPGAPPPSASEAVWKEEGRMQNVELPQADLAEARRLIFKHGYGRPKEELEDAEAALQNRRQG